MTVPGRRRLVVLSLTLVFMISLFLLAASISRLQFEPGKVYTLPPQGRVAGENPPPLPGNRWLDYLNTIFWGTMGLLLIGAIVAAILSKEHRRELLAVALITTIIGGLGWYVWFHAHPERHPFPSTPSRPEMELPEQPTEAPLEPMNPPSWSPFLLFLLVLGAAGLLAWRFVPRFWERESPLEGLADLAGEAAAELRGGAAVHDVVLRCYREMSDLLSKRENVTLHKAMTAREFERQLRRAGVQDKHVSQLSRLFEEVRYGRRGSGPHEAAEAIACLEAIEEAYGKEDG